MGNRDPSKPDPQSTAGNLAGDATKPLQPNGTAALLFRRVQHVVITVENGLGVHLDTESLDYARFVLHVQFLLQRLVSRAMLRSQDTSFFEFAKIHGPNLQFVEGLVKARNDLDRSAVSEVMDSIKRKANSEDLTERECCRGMHCRP